MLIGDAASIPEMLIELDVTEVLRAALVTAVNVKLFGIVSGAGLLLLAVLLRILLIVDE